MEVDPPPRSEHGSGPPEVNTEVDPLEVNMEVDPPEVNTEVDPPEVNMEVDPPRSGCGRGSAEKYCWASGQYALEKKTSLFAEFLAYFLFELSGIYYMKSFFIKLNLHELNFDHHNDNSNNNGQSDDWIGYLCETQL